MKSFKFKLRFAFSNIWKNIGNSLSFVLSFALVALFALLLSNVFSVSRQALYYQSIEKYGDIDVVVTYDEDASSRIVNRRSMTEEYAVYVDKAYSFFNLSVVAETASDTFYVDVMSANTSEFELLVDTELGYVGDTDAVITETMAKKYDLQVGNDLTMYLLGQTYTYEIIRIIPDEGLFCGNSVFVDKTKILDEFLGLPQLDNLGNTLYICLENDIECDDFIAMIEANPQYSDYLIYASVDQNLINTRATRMSSILFGIGVLLAVALVMVMHSLFPLIAAKLRSQYGTIVSLGGSGKFILPVWLVELAVYFLIGGLIGLFSSFLIFQYVAHTYGIEHMIKLDFLMSFIAFLVLGVLMLAEGYVNYRKIVRTDPISLSFNKRYEKQHLYGLLIPITFLVVILVMVFKPFTSAWNSLAIVVFSLMFAFLSISATVSNISRSIKKHRPKNLFGYFNNTYLGDNIHIHRSLKTLLISILIIVMSLSVREFIFDETAKANEAFLFDYALVNIFDYSDDLKQEILDDYPVEMADEALFYQNVYINFSEEENQETNVKISYFVSIDPDMFNSYFRFGFEGINTLSSLPNDRVYVVIPKNYSQTYNLSSGDTVELDIGPSHDPVTAVIAGFLDTNYEGIVYSNLMMVAGHETDYNVNSMLIRAENAEDIFRELSIDYGEEMYYVLDMDEVIGEVESEVTTAGNLFLVLTAVLVTCFMIIIVNDTLLVYYSLEKDLARLKAIGVGKKDIMFSLLTEAALTMAIVCVFVLLETMVLTAYLPKVMLFFHYYKEVVPSGFTLMLGLVLGFASYVFGYFLYYRKIIHTDIMTEMRIE
ncbi:MAG TPA: hypothetical protein PLD07_04065 [Bacillota bacterium]|nr:hypothetical protein [Bacillota bacterium]